LYSAAEDSVPYDATVAAIRATREGSKRIAGHS
jgi:hypothetical protein